MAKEVVTTIKEGGKLVLSKKRQENVYNMEKSTFLNKWEGKIQYYYISLSTVCLGKATICKLHFVLQGFRAWLVRTFSIYRNCFLSSENYFFLSLKHRNVKVLLQVGPNRTERNNKLCLTFKISKTVIQIKILLLYNLDKTKNYFIY